MPEAHPFLGACGLPGAWAGQAQWRILELGFGSGLNFLHAWRAWKDDPQRPRLLHFVAVEQHPASQAELLLAASHPDLLLLAQALRQQWIGLLPGVHRLAFEGGHVLLTVLVLSTQDALRREFFTADSIFLNDSGDARDAPPWDLHTFKAVARHCRRETGLACSTAAWQVRRDLAQCGFTVQEIAGSSPGQPCLKGVFSPAWEPKGKRRASGCGPGRTCVVVGAGLTGGAAAASLARRGWKVTVLDAADAPAAGASGLPVGMLAPHHSTDDNLLSRLTRAGIRITLQEAGAILQKDVDWAPTGVLQHRLAEPSTLAADALEAGLCWTRAAEQGQIAAALLEGNAPAWWHEQAAWIKPAALVRAWLSQPGIEWHGNARVERLVREGSMWRLLDAHDKELAQADLVVVAAALESARLSWSRLPLIAVRGQVSWAHQNQAHALPRFPVNGQGHFIAHVPDGDGAAWFCGSTYDRDDTDLGARAADHLANLERLRTLLPAVAQQLAPDFEAGRVNAWTGVRCASSNRRPLLGEIEPGLWVSTAMGSRGLTFAALCAELLAARLHDEPLPLERKLADALLPVVSIA